MFTFSNNYQKYTVMKSYRLALAATFFICIFSSLSLLAQDEREDVVYLKSGSIYRGVIIEQVPGVSLKIETLGGNVFNVAIGDVAKFTREKKELPTEPAASADGNYGYGGRGEKYFHHYRYAMGDSHARPQFHYRKKGYFISAQLLIENLMGGGRLVNGYKFGKCGYLGIGIGVDGIANDLRRNNSDYSGFYMPLYLYYGGDILRKRITPFYSIEAGYAIRMNPSHNGTFPGGDIFNSNSNSNITDRKGGLMGGVGFGVKFYSRHKVYFSISAHADFQQARNTYTGYTYDPNGNYYAYSYKTHTTLMIPGIRLGLGF